MKNKIKRLGAALLAHLKSFVAVNTVLKIISLLFAMLLWFYVMIETNPSRTKTVNNVSISFVGEDDLRAKNLVVRGDKSKVLPKATVQVSTELAKYGSVDASTITATVSLRAISKPDTYKLKINAVSQNGSVVEITPSEITIEVATMAARTVPVEVEYTGTTATNYWAGEPTLSAQNLIVRGAAEDVAQVVKAVCPIDLTGRKTGINESVALKLVDAQGEPVNMALFTDALPSVVVRMDVLKTAVLEVDAQGAVLGEDALAKNFELAHVVATPATVRVAGTESAIEGLTTISTEKLDVSGRSESLMQTLALIVPENVTLLDDPTVSIFADIRERTETRVFTDVPIEIIGLPRKQSATLSMESGSVTVVGRVSLMRQLQRGDVQLHIDVSGMTPGEHTAQVVVKLPSESMTNELSCVLSVHTVTVKIKA
ncbi:MAG: hypothetical protein LBN26_02375 [Christensenellaceae bacterium]|jgi:YbbR domain-containing protein|nr:hypothetical protein [Christensenellaceae bacterium]